MKVRCSHSLNDIKIQKFHELVILTSRRGRLHKLVKTVQFFKRGDASVRTARRDVTD